MIHPQDKFGEGRERLFELSFQIPLDPALEHWKYEVMQGFHHAIYGADGDMLAHYAGFPRRMVGLNSHLVDETRSVPTEGNSAKEFAVLQIGDVMVHPAHRGVLKRRGLFFSVSEEFIEHYVGAFVPKERRVFRWIYGFPNDRHLRIGQHLGLYSPVGAMYELSWRTTNGLPDTQDAQQLTIDSQRLDADFFEHNRKAFDDWSFGQLEQLAQGLGVCLGRKHADWWHCRFLSWPSYEVCGYFAQDASKGVMGAPGSSLMARLKGLAAIRKRAEGDRIVLEILDCLADYSLWPAILFAILHSAQSDGADEVRCWVSEPAAVFLKDTSRLAQVHCEALRLPFCLASGAWALPAIDKQLWVMGGDTDFR